MTKYTTTTTKKIKSRQPFEDTTSSLNNKFPSMSSVEYVLADLVNVPDQTGYINICCIALYFIKNQLLSHISLSIIMFNYFTY